jgi:hypothetical protein
MLHFHSPREWNQTCSLRDISQQTAGAKMKTKTLFGSIAAIVALVVILAALAAHAEPQQMRLYDARGNSIGTAAPQGQGSVRYYDSRGNSVGTSTTNSTGTTTFYGPRGNVTGTIVGPVGPVGRGR